MDTQPLPIQTPSEEQNAPHAHELSDREIDFQYNIGRFFLILKSLAVLVFVAFVFHGVWGNSPFIAFGLYVIPMTIVVAKLFKTFKPYGVMSLLIGFSTFSFLWSHNLGSLALALIFGAMTIAIYMIRKYVHLRDERLDAEAM